MPTHTPLSRLGPDPPLPEFLTCKGGGDAGRVAISNLVGSDNSCCPQAHPPLIDVPNLQGPHPTPEQGGGTAFEADFHALFGPAVHGVSGNWGKQLAAAAAGCAPPARGQKRATMETDFAVDITRTTLPVTHDIHGSQNKHLG